MKHEPLNWQFGDDEVVFGLPDTKNESEPALGAPSSSRRKIWLTVFLIALAASWTTGFYLGRLQQTTAAMEATIQGRLDVESWAWQQGDWGLFRSLLPRGTPSWQLKVLQDRFNAVAPQDRDVKLSHYVVSEDGNQVEAIVQVFSGDQIYEFERTYRLINGRWWLVHLGEFDWGS